MKRTSLAVAASVLAGLTVGVWLLAADLPAPAELVSRSSPDATKIYDRHGRLLYEVLDPRAGRRTRVRTSELPLHVTQAVIAVEDASFYGNRGIEPRGIARAALQMARQRRIVSGGSTITQQLARQVLLSAEERRARSFPRKAREMILAVRITRAYPKDRILEMYLNEVYFGQLAYGIEAASQTYFGKPARELDLAESALLTGLIQSPSAYNPLVDLDAARARQAVVLGLMTRSGFITADEAELARSESLHLTGGQVPLEAPHFVTYVRNLLEGRYGAEKVNRGGLHVVTSLDLDLQRRAEAIVARRMAELNEHEPGKPDYRARDAALVALDVPTGDILAMVGSADYFDETIDGAVNVALAPRQPGSAIKPVTYAAAFDVDRWGLPRRDSRLPDAQGGTPSDAIPAAAARRARLPFTPATVIADVPTSFLTRENEPYRPMNYDRMWHGPIPLRRALATSSNMVAVKVLEAIGTDAMIDTAEALGIATLSDRDRYGLALTLGGGEVKLLELTAAYATLANGGHRVIPRPVLAVMDADDFERARADLDTVGRDRQPGSALQALLPQVAYLITDILADDEARLPAFGENSVLRLNRPAAAKTGTTTDFRDNWTVGYTPDLATGVWMGNADNSPMQYISGITGAGPIWHEFMTVAHQGSSVRDFARPEGLVEVEVCSPSGHLPTPLCKRRRRELFIRGTEPTVPDKTYQLVALDAASGLAWAEGCRGPRIERVFRLLGPDAADWGRSIGVPEPPAETCLGGAAPIGAERSGSQTVTGNRSGAAGLVVVQPAPNTTFALSTQLPRSFQQIEVAARSASDLPLVEVTLLVDGRTLTTQKRPPYRTAWPVTPGEHRVQAVGIDAARGEVKSEPIRFTVLEEEAIP